MSKIPLRLLSTLTDNVRKRKGEVDVQLPVAPNSCGVKAPPHVHSNSSAD